MNLSQAVWQGIRIVEQDGMKLVHAQQVKRSGDLICDQGRDGTRLVRHRRYLADDLEIADALAQSHLAPHRRSLYRSW